MNYLFLYIFQWKMLEDDKGSEKNNLQEKKLLKSKRRSKRAEVKESFECSCGKKYLSFSALYLHSRNQHDVRISSKPDPGSCSVEKGPGLTKFKYSLERNIPQDDKRNSEERSPPDQPVPKVEKEEQREHLQSNYTKRVY